VNGAGLAHLVAFGEDGAMSDEPTSDNVYCKIYIAVGPHEVLVGTYQTNLMAKDMGIATVSDVRALSSLCGSLSSFGPGARAVAAECRRAGNGDLLASSPWMDQLDWSSKPANGQPRW
jgi:hypothetical protein